MGPVVSYLALDRRHSRPPPTLGNSMINYVHLLPKLGLLKALETLTDSVEFEGQPNLHGPHLRQCHP